MVLIMHVNVSKKNKLYEMEGLRDNSFASYAAFLRFMFLCLDFRNKLFIITGLKNITCMKDLKQKQENNFSGGLQFHLLSKHLTNR